MRNNIVISIIDFVKAFNTNLNYYIVVYAEESCDPLTHIYSNKDEFLKKCKVHRGLTSIISKTRILTLIMCWMRIHKKI